MSRKAVLDYVDSLLSTRAVERPPEPSEQVIEAAAKAHHNAGGDRTTWEGLSESWRRTYRNRMRVALKAAYAVGRGAERPQEETR